MYAVDRYTCQALFMALSSLGYGAGVEPGDWWEEALRDFYRRCERTFIGLGDADLLLEVDADDGREARLRHRFLEDNPAGL